MENEENTCNVYDERLISLKCQESPTINNNKKSLLSQKKTWTKDLNKQFMDDYLYKANKQEKKKKKKILTSIQNFS